MLIKDLLQESYSDELEDTIQDILVGLMTKDLTQIATDKLLNLIAKEGYVIGQEELVNMLSKPIMQGFVSQVDTDKIYFTNATADVDAVGSTDVSSMAQGQAMDDIKAEI